MVKKSSLSGRGFSPAPSLLADRAAPVILSEAKDLSSAVRRLDAALPEPGSLGRTVRKGSFRDRRFSPASSSELFSVSCELSAVGYCRRLAQKQKAPTKVGAHFSITGSLPHPSSRCQVQNRWLVNLNFLGRDNRGQDLLA